MNEPKESSRYLVSYYFPNCQEFDCSTVKVAYFDTLKEAQEFYNNPPAGYDEKRQAYCLAEILMK